MEPRRRTGHGRGELTPCRPPPIAAPRLAVVTKNRTNPAYGGALVGAKRSAARYGASLDYFAPETPDDIDEQAALLEKVIAGRYDAVIVMPAHESALDPTLDKVDAAGIPVIFVVTRPKRRRGVTFISSDDKALARATAANLFDHLGGRGDVVVIDGHPNSTTTPDRHAGFMAAIADYPGIRLLDARSGGYQRQPAHDVMRALLDRHPKIDGIVVANDLMALGVIDALHETGRRIPLVSINGTPGRDCRDQGGRHAVLHLVQYARLRRHRRRSGGAAPAERNDPGGNHAADGDHRRDERRRLGQALRGHARPSPGTMSSHPDDNSRCAAEKYLPTVRFMSTVLLGKKDK